METVAKGGIGTGTVVSSGAQLQVQNGGSVTSTKVLSGGTMLVSSGGILTDTNLSAGARLNGVFSATKTLELEGSHQITNASATELTVLSGALTTSLTVNAGGTLSVAEGGSTSSVILRGKAKSSALQQIVGSNTSAINTIVSAYGKQNVAQGGVANKTKVRSGTMIVGSGGFGNAATISKGGVLRVEAGGVASGTNVLASGSMLVSSGGSLLDTTLAQGGLLNKVFQATGKGVSLSGDHMVTNASATQLSVNSGALTTSLTVSAGGTLVVEEGGTTENVTLIGKKKSAGVQRVNAQGVANNTLVSQYGRQEVANVSVANESGRGEL